MHLTKRSHHSTAAMPKQDFSHSLFVPTFHFLFFDLLLVLREKEDRSTIKYNTFIRGNATLNNRPFCKLQFYFVLYFMLYGRELTAFSGSHDRKQENGFQGICSNIFNSFFLSLAHFLLQPHSIEVVRSLSLQYSMYTCIPCAPSIFNHLWPSRDPF